MIWTGDLIVIVCVSFTIIAALIKILNQLWWAPMHLQNLLGRSGSRGPGYRFIHGNSKEIKAMEKEAMLKPMDLSDHNIIPRIHPHIHRWTSLYGKSYLQWDGGQAELVVTEPSLVKEVFSDKDAVYGKEKTKPFVKRLLGNGLVTSEGEKWAKVRKLANHAFHAESLKRMIPDMIESTEIMLERWKHIDGKEVEVYQEFRFFTSEVISKTAFGSSYLEGQKIFELLAKLNFVMCQNFYKQALPVVRNFFKTGDEIEAKRLEKEIHESIMDLIRKRDESGAKDHDYGSDFLGSLLKTHHDANESERISVDDVIEECKTFYFAGQETTNSLLSWVMFLLATHVDWQEKARNEVNDLLGKRNPKLDDLAKLKIMNMIINECLRLYPPAISLIRQVKREVKLGNFTLPANVKVLTSILAIHCDPEVWGQDANRFKPERFSEGVANATKNNIAAFLPFGIGPRTCVGFNFAMAEAKVALAMILQKYSFTLSPGYVHSPTQVLTIRPQYGVQVFLYSL